MLPANQIRAPSHMSTTLNLLLAEENMKSQMLSSVSGSQSTITADSTARSVRTAKSKISEDLMSITSAGQDHRASMSQVRPDTCESTRSHVSFKKDLVSGGNVIPEHEETQGETSSVKAEQDDMEQESYLDDEYSEHESGHEGDVDTATDFTSLPGLSRLSGRVPTKDEIRREFAKCMSERLVQATLLAGSHDNITVMVILLPGCGLWGLK